MSKSKIIKFDNEKYKNNTKKEISLDDKIKSDDYLEMAYDATSKSVAIKYAKQALEVNPANIDAQCVIADFEENEIKRLKKYETILKDATRILEEDDMFTEDNIGMFWGIMETRPYMRIRHRKILSLMTLGRYTEAIVECEEMLRLCENDNMGVRYLLIGLYCVLEKFEECEKLFYKYEDYSLHMVFPMAIMYFKKGNYKKAKEFLSLSEQANEHILDFILEIAETVPEDLEIQTPYYSQGGEEEAFLVIHDLMYLLGSLPGFIGFVINEYRK